MVFGKRVIVSIMVSFLVLIVSLVYFAINYINEWKTILPILLTCLGIIGGLTYFIVSQANEWKRHDQLIKQLEKAHKQEQLRCLL